MKDVVASGRFEDLDVKWEIVSRNGHYNGYVTFKRRSMEQSGYDGILTYVPVHGGITYAGGSAQDYSYTYGFDCAHADDDKDPRLRDLDFLRSECYKMAKAIIIASRYECSYELRTSQRVRAGIIADYCNDIQKAGIELDYSKNFGFMFRLLCGL